MTTTHSHISHPSTSPLSSTAAEWHETLGFLSHFADLDIFDTFSPVRAYLGHGEARRQEAALSLAHHIRQIDALDHDQERQEKAFGLLEDAVDGLERVGRACYGEVRTRLTSAWLTDALVSKGTPLRRSDLGTTHLSRPTSAPAPARWRDRHEAVRLLYACFAFALVEECWTFTVTPEAEKADQLLSAGKFARRTTTGALAHGFTDGLRAQLKRRGVAAGRDDLHLALAAEGISKRAAGALARPHVHGLVLIRPGDDRAVSEALSRVASAGKGKASPTAVHLKPFDPDAPEQWAHYLAPGFCERHVVPSAAYISQPARRAAQALHDADRHAFLHGDIDLLGRRRYKNPAHWNARRNRLA